jgi:hypothetical protein
MNKSFIDKISKMDRFELLELYNKTTIYRVDALQTIESELQKRELDFEAHDYAYLKSLENEENPLEPNLLSDEEAAVSLYSRSAVFGFSIFFSTIFGSILLMINLRRLGEKRKGFEILLLGIAYAVLSSVLVDLAGANLVLSLVLNVLGGYLMSTYFWAKYIGLEFSHKKQSILIPLILGIAMSLIATQYLISLGELPV